MNSTDPPLVNVDDTHTTGIPFSNTIVPEGPHTISMSGGKRKRKMTRKIINRRRISKIARKYKVKGSKSLRRIKNRLKRCVSRRHSRRRSQRRNYRGGYSQYQNNNGSLSNTYSLGSNLDASSSALANPPPYKPVAGDVDNLNHNALNAYGNSGSGAGFASRGWF